MPRSNTGPGGRTLTGGRALYTGKNAYASQGFENDTRQSQLGGLVSAYLWGNQTTANGTETVVSFNQNYTSATVSPVFVRGFTFSPSLQAFICQATGTYRFMFSADVNTLVAADTVTIFLRVWRGTSVRTYRASQTNTDAVTSMRTPVTCMGYVDLRPGDRITLSSISTTGVLLAGGTTGTSTLNGLDEILNATYLHLEQTDLPAPA